MFGVLGGRAASAKAASPDASCWNGTCVMADNGYSAFKGLDGHSE